MWPEIVERRRASSLLLPACLGSNSIDGILHGHMPSFFSRVGTGDATLIFLFLFHKDQSK